MVQPSGTVTMERASVRTSRALATAVAFAIAMLRISRIASERDDFGGQHVDPIGRRGALDELSTPTSSNFTFGSHSI